MRSILKFTLLCLASLLASTSVQGQDSDGVAESEYEIAAHENQKAIDSLIILLMNAPDSVNNVDVYLELSNEYLGQNHNKALNYAKEGLEKAFAVEDHLGMLNCHMAIAHIHIAYTLNLQSALASYEDALEIAKEMGRKQDQLEIYRGIGNIYASLENFEAAIDYMTQSLAIAEELKDKAEISSINAYMGSMYEEDGDTLKAMDYYKEVYEIEKSRKFNNTSNPSLITIAHYHFLIDDIDKAIHFYRVALKRFQRNLDNRWLSYTHSRLAHLYLSQDNFQRAEAHAVNGLSIAQDFDLTKEITDNYLILVDIADSMGKHDLAKRYKEAYEHKISHIRKDAHALNAKVDEIGVEEEQNTQSQESGKTKAKEASLYRFVDAIIVTLPILLIVLIMSMPSRSKDSH